MLLFPGVHNFKQAPITQSSVPHRFIRNYNSVVKVNLDSSMQCTCMTVLFLSAISTAEHISSSLFLTSFYKFRTSDFTPAPVYACFLFETTK